MHREPGACVTRPSLVGHGARVARREARAQLCETSLQAVHAVFFSFGVVKKPRHCHCVLARWNHDGENVQQKQKVKRAGLVKLVKRDW
jgi:hypothetical protein